MSADLNITIGHSSYLILPSFLSEIEANELLQRSKVLLDQFDPNTHPMVYPSPPVLRDESHTLLDQVHDRRR